MPTRAIRLKLIIPRDDSEESVLARQALWATHAFGCEAVAYYERLFLELRQQEVLKPDPDGEPRLLSGEYWTEQLMARLETRGLPGETISAALPLLKDLYPQIIQSAQEGVSGTAQQATTYHSLLVDPDSKAMEADLSFVGIFEPLIAPWRAEDGDWREPNDAWARVAHKALEEHPEVTARTGVAPRWLKAYQQRDPEWTAHLFRDVVRKVANPAPGLLVALRALQVFPVADPYGKGRVASRGVLSKIERWAYSAACRHLLSFETWSQRTRAQLAERRAAVEEWDASYAESHGDALAAIRIYEAERQERLTVTGAGLGAGPVYTVRGRELRGWRELRVWLREHRDASAKERQNQLGRLQGELGKRFGGAELWGWLAALEQQWLAEHPAGDVVSRVAKRNELQDLVNRTKPLPTFTFADPQQHPRDVGYDPPRNRNQPPYEITGSAAKLQLTLSLLTAAGAKGPRVEQSFVFALAPSGQARKAVIKEAQTPSKKRELEFIRESQDKLALLRGSLRGGNLIFERRGLRSRTPEAQAAGTLGSVYFKVATDVGQPGEELAAESHDARSWLSSSLGERAKKAKAAIAPSRPIRVMSVHLGVKNAATIAVGTVAPAMGKDGSVEISPALSHERTAILRLPGDKPTRGEQEERAKAERDLARIRYEIRRLGTFRKLALAETRAGRDGLLEELSNPRRWDADRELAVSADLLEPLRGRLDADDETWRTVSFAIYRSAETDLGLTVQAWRKVSRKRRRAPMGRKSHWQVDYLERVYRLLLSWHLHQPPSRDKVQRQRVDERGQFAASLRRHVANLKDDRAKTTADMIVQAARGLVYQDGRWQQRFEPVDLVVFGDLAQYRPQSDRSREENRRLMQWTHRRVRELLELQAEEYGFRITDGMHLFSGRLDPDTGAPGIRCKALNGREARSLQEGRGGWLGKSLLKAGIRSESVQAGDMVPVDGGDLLVFPRGDGVGTKHADVVAAQNLLRWYAQGHPDVVRLSTSPQETTEGKTVYVTDVLGRRYQGAVGGQVAVFTRENGNGSYRMEVFSTRTRARRSAKVWGDATGDTAKLVLCRDPSAAIGDGAWMPASEFWPAVQSTVLQRLRGSGKLHG